MRRKEYACPNGCSLPPRRKQLREYNDGTYGFDFYDFTFCPCCGSLMPYSLKKLKGFFEVYNIHAALSDAVQLIYKSEFESAAREAFVAVENYLKKKSGLDSHGFDLATRALSFEIDKQTGEIKRAPLIAINDLKNESQRNEQDGIRYMLMGFFQGPRNLYQHNHIGSGVSNSISVIIEASFLDYFGDRRYIHDYNTDGWMEIDSKIAQIYMRTLAEYSIKCSGKDIVLGTDTSTHSREIYNNSRNRADLQAQCCKINIENCLPQPSIKRHINF